MRGTALASRFFPRVGNLVSSTSNVFNWAAERQAARNCETRDAAREQRQLATATPAAAAAAAVQVTNPDRIIVSFSSFAVSFCSVLSCAAFHQYSRDASRRASRSLRAMLGFYFLTPGLGALARDAAVRN